MLLHCVSKLCNTTRDHKLKVDTDEAVCMECKQTNPMVSDFMKKAMKSAGDIFRSAQSKKAFTFKCLKCTVERGVKIIDEVAVCEICHHPFNLTPNMLEAIRTTAPKSETIAETKDEPAAEEEVSKGVVKRRKQ